MDPTARDAVRWTATHRTGAAWREALAAIDARQPALLLDAEAGVVLGANGAGRALLTGEPRDPLLEALLEALRTRPPSPVPLTGAWTPGPGMPPTRWLLVPSSAEDVEAWLALLYPPQQPEFVAAESLPPIPLPSSMTALGRGALQQQLLLVTDERSRIVWASAAMERHTGWTLREMLGRTPGQLLQGPQTDRRTAQAIGRLVRAGRACRDVEILNYTRSGQPYWANMEIEPVRDEAGAVRWFVASLLDVTARRLSLVELRELSDQIALLQRFNRFGFFRRNLLTGEGAWDAHVFRQVGRDPRLGVPSFNEFLALIHAEDRAAFLQAWTALIETGEPGGARYRIHGEDGSLRFVHSAWSVERDATGRPVRVLGLMVDDTGTHHAAEARAAADRRLSLATALATLGGFEIDFVSHTVRFEGHLADFGPTDPRTRAIPGRLPEPVTMRVDEAMALVHPEDAPHVHEVLREAAASDGVQEVEYRFRAPDGRWRHLVVRLTSVADASGNRRIVAVALDVTKQRRQQEELEALLDRFELATRIGGIGVWDWRAGGTHWTCNEVLRLQLSLPETLGVQDGWAHVFESIVPGDRARLDEVFSALRDGRVTETSGEFGAVDAQGRVRLLEMHARVSRDASGAVARVTGVTRDVTAMRSEARRWEFMTHSALGVWDVDLLRDELWVTRQLATRFGFASPGPWRRGGTWSHKVHPDDLARVGAQFDALREGRIPEVDTEYRLRDVDGRWRVVQDRAAPVERGPDGRPSRFIGYMIDITEQREAEAAEREQANLASIAASVNGLGFWSFDSAAKRFTVDAACCVLYGVSGPESLATFSQWKDRLHPDDRDAALAATGRAWAEGKVYTTRFRVVHPDGGVRWMMSRSRADFDDEGNVLRVLGVNWDVTAQVEAEERSADQAARLNMIGESIGIGLWELDYATRTIAWDAQSDRIFAFASRPGETAVETLARTIDARDQERIQAERRRAQGSDDIFEADYDVHGDDEVRTITSRGRVVRDQTGRPVRLVGIHWDSTAQRRALDAEREREEIERASRAKTEFLSRISHEFRTPLNAVLGFSRLLSADASAPLTARQRDRVDGIHQAGQHLLEMVNEILDLTRIEAGVLEVDLRTIPLREISRDALAMFAPEAERARVTLALDAPAEVLASADDLRLREVLWNLVSNAIKYNRAGGRVDVRIRAAGPAAVIEVEDTGIGIPQSRLHDLFEPFNRLGRENGGVPGTGLGLAICRMLVRRMGGTLALDSVEERGTVARVQLARRRASPDPAGTAEAAVPAAKPESPTPAAPACALAAPREVLYIEDNALNRALVEQYLHARPALRLRQATNAAEGLAMLAERQPALLLLDLHLPDGDAPTLIRRLRDDPANAGLRIAVLSADALPEAQEACTAAGADAFWTKPILADTFLARVDEQIALSVPPAGSRS